MRLDPAYTAAWIVWALLFVLIEGSALAKRSPGNGTLTWNLRRLLCLNSRSIWTGRLIAIAALAWLCWHFLYPVVK